jgi:kinesin family protein 5
MAPPGDHKSTPSRSSIAASELSLQSTISSSNIKVIARFRPENEIERTNQGSIVVDFLSEDSCQINTKDFNGTFTFDRVFNTESQQEEVFEYSLRQTVDDLMKGYNGTVLAYGQTGSGKSYTMMGSNIDDSIYRGAIPRIVDMIFEMILQSSSDIEYTVRVSYMEIYMERIKDLLNPRNDNLPIHEDKARGVYVKGLTEEYVSSAEEVYEVMRQGSGARAVASTNMNQESSRSHSIFAIVVTQKNTISGAQKSGQLFLVDLAGSEKVGKTGASGQTLEEAKKINKSLSALGMVINSLTDGKSSHIPYRDSKLTRILQESLGGNSRTSLIVNCSPSSFNDSETLSTLRFGVRAKNIRNKAKINTELSPLELRQLLKKSQRQLEARIIYSNKLESELVAWRNGEAPGKETWVTIGSLESIKTHASNNSISSAFSAASRSTSALSSRPTTPSLLKTTKNTHTKKPSTVDDPSAPSSAPSSPIPPENSEDVESMEDFIRRENELQDQLSEKEAFISQQEQALFELRAQLSTRKAEELNTAKETGELKLQVDNLNYEKKELEIKTAGLKEENEQLNKDLQDAKQKIIELSVSSSSLNPEENKEKTTATNEETFDSQKRKKMSEIFGSFYNQANETDTSATATALEQAITMLNEIKLEDSNFEEQMSAAKAKLSTTLETLGKVNVKNIEDTLKTQDFKFRQYVEELDESEETKNQIETAYEARLKVNDETATQLLAEISRLQKENHELQSKQAITLPSAGAEKENGDGTAIREAAAAQEKIQSMQSHIEQFESMKTALMKDLQDRCERIVELEISLDQARAQYNLAIRDTNNKQQQKKMALLQRNLEQLTQVQRQLVEQNVVLKKDVAMAHKILDARNDRIQTLESALRDSQNRFNQESELFETKLTYLREKLLEVKKGNNSNNNNGNDDAAMQRTIPMVASVGSNNRVAHYPDLSPLTQPYQGAGLGNTKIVKPLRGGGGGSTSAKEGLWNKLNSIVNMTP